MLLPSNLLTGLDVLLEKDLAPLRGRTVGIITNHTGRNGRHWVDVLHAVPGVHGISQEAQKRLAS